VIEFICPHCKNTMKVPDELAGRDAWCRSCKHFIVIPKTSGGEVDLAAIPLPEMCKRLARMVHFAASRADKFRDQLAAYRDEGGELISIEALKAAAQPAPPGKAPDTAKDKELEETREHMRKLSGRIARDEAERQRLVGLVTELSERLEAAEKEYGILQAELDAVKGGAGASGLGGAGRHPPRRAAVVVDMPDQDSDPALPPLSEVLEEAADGDDGAPPPKPEADVPLPPLGRPPAGASRAPALKTSSEDDDFFSTFLEDEHRQDAS
jgi:hypothetical protein